MKSAFPLIGAVLLLTSSCATHSPAVDSSSGPPTAIEEGITYEGGDGSSCDKAVLIRGAKHNGEGIEAEYAWLGEHCPGFRRDSQGLHSEDERHYDVVTIETMSGSPVTVCFDITEFFGTW
jgi:hypothetical protein